MTKAKAVAQKTKDTLLDAYGLVLAEERQAFEAALAEEKAKFDALQAEQLAAWKKDLARIKDEDNYQFNKEKREREDALKAEITKRFEEVVAREAKATEREAAVGDAEKTITGLQKQVDGIPALVASEKNTAFNEGYVLAQKDAEREAKVVEAGFNAEKGVLQSKVDSLQNTVASLEATIATLREDLAKANLRVETIATSAVQAAGNARVTVQNTPATTGR